MVVCKFACKVYKRRVRCHILSPLGDVEWAFLAGHTSKGGQVTWHGTC